MHLPPFCSLATTVALMVHVRWVAVNQSSDLHTFCRFCVTPADRVCVRACNKSAVHGAWCAELGCGVPRGRFDVMLGRSSVTLGVLARSWRSLALGSPALPTCSLRVGPTRCESCAREISRGVHPSLRRWIVRAAWREPTLGDGDGPRWLAHAGSRLAHAGGSRWLLKVLRPPLP